MHQSPPGPQITASRVYTNAEVRGPLGRDLVGRERYWNVYLIAPGTMFSDRMNQLDFRVSKKSSDCLATAASRPT